jgi:hypothetical protein
MVYAIGLDIGQASDPAALAVVGMDEYPVSSLALNAKSKRKEMRFDVIWLEEFPLGTEYRVIVERVKFIMEQEDPMINNNCRLVMDFGQVGRAVREMFQEVGITPVCINILGSMAGESRRTSVGYNVPKVDLVSVLHVAFSFGQIKIAENIKGIDDRNMSNRLMDELGAFKMKLTKANNMTFEAATESMHDDLVIAVAIACWYLEETALVIIPEIAHEHYDVLRHGFSGTKRE